MAGMGLPCELAQFIYIVKSTQRFYDSYGHEDGDIVQLDGVPGTLRALAM